MTSRHSLLLRQIRRHLGSEDAVPAELRGLLDAVDVAYQQADADRTLLERAMDLSSQELMQANSEMQAIFLAIPDLFFRFDAAGTILDCRGAPADLMRPAAELVGKRMQSLPVRDAGAALEEAIHKVNETGAMVRLEYALEWRGQRQLYEARLLPLRLRNQRIAIIRNITELKQVEEALRQSERDFRDSVSLLQATLDSTADGIMAVDLKGGIVELNRRFVEMWRIPGSLLNPPQSERILTFTLEQLEEPEKLRVKLREIYARPEAESHDVVRLRDGRVFEGYSQPQRTGGESVGRVWSFRDVTESLRLEKERARLQIVGALGHLVGALAHEVRNPLFAISATLETIEAGLADHPSPFFHQAIQNLREPTRRLSELMSELLEYGKPPSNALAASSLIEIVSQAVSDCAGLAAEKGVRMSTRLNGWEPRVGAVRRRLLIAVQNLLQNAIQHTPKGGEVTVEVEEFELASGLWARCRFLDSGTGFKAEDLPRIFEPFFTRRRGGTGLGLSIVQRIVEEHGGRVAAGNRPEGGAVMTLELPHWGGGEPPQSQGGGLLERATLFVKPARP